MKPPDNPLQTSTGYGQVCAIALGLDHVGSRWSLLLLRDLARSPLRFVDLKALNPGLSPSVLATRLRELENSKLIGKRPGREPGRNNLYAITPSSRPYILNVLGAMSDLGAHLLDVVPPDVDPAAAFAAQLELNSRYMLARGSALEGYFELNLIGWKNYVIIDRDHASFPLEAPPDRQPNAIAVFNPPTTLMRIIGGSQTTQNAEQAQELTITGDRTEMLELLRLLSIDDI